MKKILNYYGPFKPYSNWHKLLLTMNITAFLLFCGLMNLIAVPTYSHNTGDESKLIVAMQQQIITGKVTNKSGDPLAGVSVVVKGTSTGTITGTDGSFSLSLPADARSLSFSFVGMSPIEMPIGNDKVFNVILEESAIGLEDVVVVGYGKQRKATLTGSVTSVADKELKASPSINVTAAITGLMTGVITKAASGEPGRDNPIILIHGLNTTGNNEPLVVVDGIQGVSGWERINSNDIESISVLKDASAAIYGARAANGVILITTKRGSLGKPVITYSFNQSIIQPTRIPKMANSAEFAGYVNQLVEEGQKVADKTFLDA